MGISSGAMQLRLVVLACLVLGLHGSQRAEVLTDENFHALIKGDTWIVDFFAPWCGHCKKLAPEMDKLVSMVEGVAKVGTVDATAIKGVANAFDVHGYPTLKLFQNDGATVTDYKGPRDADGLQKFIKKMESSPIETLSTQEQLELYTAAQPTGFVLLPQASDAVATAFIEDNYLPPCPELTMGSFYDFVNSGKQTVVA